MRSWVLTKWLAWGILLLGLASCIGQRGERPAVLLESPQDGIEISLGDRVLVQSVSQGEKGVVKVELWVDGRLYEASRSQQTEGEASFSAIQIWEAPQLGSHTLVVRAYDALGQVSEPQSAEIQVVPPKPTPTVEATVVPTPSTLDNACQPSARFVEDVTVPDDSLYNGGVKFTKTWRLRNDGECTWEPGTVWAFIGGDLLGAQSPVDVELAEPGRIVDISVDMVAPAAPGTYKSYWRLQRPNKDYFGDQAYVQIVVP
jgi:hypothetical protein